jgi:hypothetical protein
MEAAVALVGGIVVAVASAMMEKNVSVNVVRAVVIFMCVVVGVVGYILFGGAPTPNSLQEWGTVILGAFGVAAGLYSWVLKHSPPALESGPDRGLMGEEVPSPRWI